LQHLLDNYRQLTPEKKKGLAGATIIHLALLLMLILISFKVLPPPEFEGGIEVNFGTGLTGFGMIEPAPFIAPPVSSTATRPASTPEEYLLTQETEEAPEVRRVDPDAERRRQEQVEAERIRREALEAERRRQEELAAEQQRQADIINRTRDALAGSRNAGAESASEGVAGGPGNQGVLTGSLGSGERGEGGVGTGAGTGSGIGVSFSLDGRRSLSLPLPTYNQQVDGRVIVEIRVNREGRVTQVREGMPGSTTLNPDLLRIAREAALRATFERKPDAPEVQVGTITYNFVLR
jgi:outer membrane biosynthesis protein TonB